MKCKSLEVHQRCIVVVVGVVGVVGVIADAMPMPLILLTLLLLQLPLLQPLLMSLSLLFACHRNTAITTTHIFNIIRRAIVSAAIAISIAVNSVDAVNVGDVVIVVVVVDVAVVFCTETWPVKQSSRKS